MLDSLKKYLGIIILLIVTSVHVYGQSDTVKLNRQYLKKYWIDGKQLVSAPFQWEKKEWTKFGVLGATTGALMLFDNSLYEFIPQREYRFVNNAVDNFFEPMGGEYSVLFCGAMYAYGLAAKNSRAESTALLAGESFVLASLLVRIPKYLFGRQRPEFADGPFDFQGPFQGSSFPSGHTTAVFAVASVIANQYSDTKWVPILSYSIAGLSGLSRVYDNKHWVSDVFAGALLGVFVGNVVSPKKNKNNKLSIVPFKSRDFYGVKLAYAL